MRVDPEHQVANAARLARMLPPASAVAERVQRVAARVAPAIAAAMAEEMDRLRVLRTERDTEEQVLMAACKAVGAAVDRLDQARHTRGEIAARLSLERAATALRRILQKRGGHGKR